MTILEIAITDFITQNVNTATWPVGLRWVLVVVLGLAIVAVAGLAIAACYNFLFPSVVSPTSPDETLEKPTVPAFQDMPDLPWAPHPVKTEFQVDEIVTAIDIDGGRSPVQLLRLKKDGLEKAVVAVIKLHDQSFWEQGQSSALMTAARQHVDLAKWFDSARLKERLAKSEFILCIGLASSNAQSKEANENLSYRRAEQLCDWLRQSSVVSNSSQRLKAVPLGMANTFAAAETELEQKQRSAIIVGVSRENQLIDLSTIYNEIASRAMVDGISLSDYSRVTSVASSLD